MASGRSCVHIHMCQGALRLLLFACKKDTLLVLAVFSFWPSTKAFQALKQCSKVLLCHKAAAFRSCNYKQQMTNSNDAEQCSCKVAQAITHRNMVVWPARTCQTRLPRFQHCQGAECKLQRSDPVVQHGTLAHIANTTELTLEMPGESCIPFAGRRHPLAML